jgi:hypothetical protein
MRKMKTADESSDQTSAIRLLSLCLTDDEKERETHIDEKEKDSNSDSERAIDSVLLWQLSHPTSRYESAGHETFSLP